MTHLFIVKYRDGGQDIKRMRVNKFGSPTRTEYDHLDNLGYVSWVNLDNRLKNGLYLDEVARVVGLV